MLLNKHTLAAIQSGDITLVYRRWKRPTVKTGGALKTAIGVLAIDHVARVNLPDITESDARQAGYRSRSELIDDLEGRQGEIYRIQLRYQQADPRIALRQLDQISDAEMEAIRTRLQRFDQASPRGPWTLAVLRAIEVHPHRAAVELAALTGFEKEWLKTNIRKLKNLGLTISHHPGYQLSPRGKAVLAHCS